MSGQNTQVLYQTLTPSEDLREIELSLTDTYTVEYWSSNQLMIETQLEMRGAPESVLEHFIEEGRYEILQDTTPSKWTFRTAQPERKTIQSQGMDCREKIEFIFYLPKQFVRQEQTNLYLRNGEGN